LATTFGVNAPEVAQLQLATGQVPGFNHPIPVVRVVFDAKVFFNFDKDSVRPEALPILDVIAENMRRDVPDANLLVLGHTDAVGTDTYNIDLSRRRATTVMQALIQRGVSAGQLATVAVGKSQPIAPNDTPDGRARNRRVEFMISASQEANIKLVSRRRIVQEYLRVSNTDTQDVTMARRVEIFRPVVVPQEAKLSQPELISPSSNSAQNKTVGGVVPSTPPPSPPVQLRSVGEIELNKPTPLADIQFRQPEKPDERALSEYDTTESHA
jgi:outer membrane protein OmpA-like peptidoglycan-associated protein